MTEDRSTLDEVLALRVNGTRSLYKIELTPDDTQLVGDVAVMLVSGEFTVLMLPTALPELLDVEIRTFVGNAAASEPHVVVLP